MKRILILGKNRSGTKYLSNLVAQKFELSCIQSDAHDGVIESNIYSNYQKIFKDNLTTENRRAVLSLFSCDALFSNSNVSLGELSDLKWNSILEFECLFFDLNAKNENRLGWVHKAESLSSPYFSNPEILKIFIDRRAEDIYISTLKLGKFSFVRKVVIALKIVLSSRVEQYYQKKFKALNISYEELLEDQGSVLKKIKEYIELPIKDNGQHLKFNNSTFKNKKRISARKWLKFIFWIQKGLIYPVPMSLLLMVNKYYLNRPFLHFISKTMVDLNTNHSITEFNRMPKT